ncbi:DUF1178 family protein [Comamonas piscis]|uniref:DUF1178 family protein n=1 Tax=Comamonas piscis TaxID=1562974 RepID=A0A7G5EKQ4_9BURK|nr:DUF1178 family protein [Comamonas piscis]QMV74579.1 DUF1178 family protein [Comamonas piscis]WSO33037.1 DUF1178 family protein [Comamonas piscis]
MKVFNLRCPLGHFFEGWFASEAAFEQQKSQGWLSCPLCNSHDIVKGLSAPHLARKSNSLPQTLPSAAAAPSAASAPPPSRAVLPPPDAPLSDAQRLQQAWLEISRQVVANTEDVGSSFADLARQMHEGEVDARPIRGTATADEHQALVEEGIDVLPLLLPEASKHRLQ